MIFNGSSELRAVLTGQLFGLFSEKFQIIAKDRAKDIVNCISQKRYDELTSVTLIDNSWCDENGSQKQAANDLTSVISKHLALWTEKNLDGKEFVIDPFIESSLVRYGVIERSRPVTFTYDYILTSQGEPIAFRLELKMYIDDEDDLISILNINV